LLAPTIFVLLAAILSAQATTASIYGNVKNDDNKGLSGVLVTGTNINTNANTPVTSGKKGTFRILALSPGIYQVSFDLEGYQSYVASGIQLSAGQSITLRVKLKKVE